MDVPLITVITPTTGHPNLLKLIDSLSSQTVPYKHLLLWDDKRDPQAQSPEDYEDDRTNSIVIAGSMVQGDACGSALRAVGLMAANTDLVTFADTDVWFEEYHFETIIEALGDKDWAYCIRKIWNDDGECYGEDHFESVGDSDERKVPYKMVDNNTMIFTRRFGASAAPLYRETTEYNDDRLMYSFLKTYAGEPGKTNMATVNQICPKKLETMFSCHCTKV